MNSTILTSVPENIKVVAVTKHHSVREIETLLKKNPKLTRIGENRIEEAKKNWESLPRSLERHFIGRLQHRKIKKIAEFFDVIQTVENEKQAEQLNRTKPGMRVFIQVNISQKENRQGSTKEGAQTLANFIREKTSLKLEGIMGMASREPEKAQKEFEELKAMQTTLKVPELSMGISSDYKMALKAGATMIRLGTCLFQG